MLALSLEGILTLLSIYIMLYNSSVNINIDLNNVSTEKLLISTKEVRIWKETKSF
jgi:hypothetical protein